MLLAIKFSSVINKLPQKFYGSFHLFSFLNVESECTKEFLFTKHFANVKIERLFWGKNGGTGGGTLDPFFVEQSEIPNEASGRRTRFMVPLP
jgi:hypothetical protein